MAATGGSLESLTLDGRSFAVAADSDTNRSQGGFNNEVKANGNGTARLIKTRVPWQVSDVNIEIDDLRGDPEFLQGLANRLDMFPVSATYTSGAIFSGEGQITGEFLTSSMEATAPVSVSGSGTFLPQ